MADPPDRVTSSGLQCPEGYVAQGVVGDVADLTQEEADIVLKDEPRSASAAHEKWKERFSSPAEKKAAHEWSRDQEASAQDAEKQARFRRVHEGKVVAITRSVQVHGYWVVTGWDTCGLDQ